jgi:aspartate aminotransferase
MRVIESNVGTTMSAAALGLPVQPIREMMALAAAAPDAIHLEVGEPDGATPKHVLEAALQAMRRGRTRYTPNAGIAELRDALATKIRVRNGYDVEPEQVIVTSGGINALYTTLLALVGPGDDVLIPDPGWPNFRAIVHMTGAMAVSYRCRAGAGYRPLAADVERLLTPRTKALVLVTPSNPTGAVLDRDDLGELDALAEEHDLWLISDECYDELAYDGPVVSTAAIAAPHRVVGVYSFSKTYAMTGWRVGYAVAPPRLAPTIARLQEPITSCVNAPAQYAALAAVSGPQDAMRQMVADYRVRRDAAIETLTAGGLPAHPPAGAFYIWADVSAAGMTSRAFARALLEQERVAVAPGSAFGPSGEGFVRVSLASPAADVAEGCRRLVAFASRQAHFASREGA